MNDQEVFNRIKEIAEHENFIANPVIDCENWYDVMDFTKPNGNIFAVHIGGIGIRNIGNVISLLKELKNLTQLYLYGKEIRGAEYLTELKNLEKLEMEFDYPFDISPIGEMKHLTNLMIHRIPLDSGKDEAMADISPLRGLTRLKNITLMLLGIADISSLRNLSELTDLDVSANNISDISSLKYLKKIKRLDLSSNCIDDISALRGLKNLIRIHSDRDNIKDISVLKYLGNIRFLSMDDNGLEDISVLAFLKKLVSLNLANNKISDISPLEGLNELDEVYLDYNKIKDFSPIRHIYFRKYHDIMIEYNPSIIPPINIIKNGEEAIKQYFKQMIKAENKMIRKVNKGLLKS